MKVGDKIGDRVVKSILSKFPVMWSGWEMDDQAWVMVFEDGTKSFVTTDHGMPTVIDAEYFNDRIDSYKRTIEATKEAIKVYENT